MVIPEERDGKNEVASELLRTSSKANETVNSRKAGGKQAEKPVQRKVCSEILF